MFDHILVPLDLSGKNRSQLAVAAELAGRGTRVTVLHVIERIEDIPFAEVRDFYRRIARIAEKKLAATVVRFARRGVRVRTAVLIGAPAAEIVRYAAARGVDLIVMGSHAVTPGRAARRWGTTSYKVGLLCRCPVMLVK